MRSGDGESAFRGDGKVGAPGRFELLPRPLGPEREPMRTAVVWRPRRQFRLLLARQSLLAILGVFLITAIITGVVISVVRPRTTGLTDGQPLLSDAEYHDPSWRCPE